MSSFNMVDKAIAILFQLRDHEGPQGVTSIARSVDLPKSSVHRLLSTLVRRGLCERDAQGRYSLGFALVSLGLGALTVEPVVAAARKTLEAAARGIGETVFLVGPRGGRLLVLDKVEGTGFMRAAPQIGSAVPVKGTAAGKLFLAFEPSALLPENETDDAAFAAPPPRVSAERMRRDVAQAKRRGYAENREQWMPGLSVIAAPVFASGTMVAAVAVAMPSAHLSKLGASRVAGEAKAASREIGARLDGASSHAGEVMA